MYGQFMNTFRNRRNQLLEIAQAGAIAAAAQGAAAPNYQNKLLVVDPDPTNNCAICLEYLMTDCVKLTNPICSHKFHKLCILGWAHANHAHDIDHNPAIVCPLCRELAFGKRRPKKSHKRKSKSRKRRSRPRRKSRNLT